MVKLSHDLCILCRIFQRFYRTQEARDEGVRGTGLGLAITQTILKKHGGAISVESAEGKGSTFIVTLPLFKRQIRE